MIGIRTIIRLGARAGMLVAVLGICILARGDQAGCSGQGALSGLHDESYDS